LSGSSRGIGEGWGLRTLTKYVWLLYWATRREHVLEATTILNLKLDLETPSLPPKLGPDSSLAILGGPVSQTKGLPQISVAASTKDNS
jgi:hypothetical protein